MKPKRIPARDSYRIDHNDFMGEYTEYFYNETFATRVDAQNHVDERNPKYRDKLKIVKFHEPAHDSYHLGIIKLLPE